MTHCDPMITTNTKFGKLRLALNDKSSWLNSGEWRIVKGPDAVLVTLILKGLDLTTMTDPAKLVGFTISYPPLFSVVLYVIRQIRYF